MAAIRPARPGTSPAGACTRHRDHCRGYQNPSLTDESGSSFQSGSISFFEDANGEPGRREVDDEHPPPPPVNAVGYGEVLAEVRETWRGTRAPVGESGGAHSPGTATTCQWRAMRPGDAPPGEMAHHDRRGTGGRVGDGGHERPPSSGVGSGPGGRAFPDSGRSPLRRSKRSATFASWPCSEGW